MNTAPLQPSHRKSWVLLLIMLPFVALAILMVSAGAGQTEPAPVEAKVHQVNVVPVSIQPGYLQQRLAYGRIEASKQASIGFELSGTLLNVLVDEGDHISADQVLAKLDTQRLDAKMQELDAALSRAEADARLAALSQKRVTELVERKLESSQRLDEVREATSAARALVAEILARKLSLQVELDKSVMRAPFDGAVLARPVDPGTVVSAGQPVLITQQNQGMQVRIALSADDAFRLQVGDRYTLFKHERPIPATLRSIARQRQLDTRTVSAIFSIEDSGQQAAVSELLPGDMLAFSYTREINEQGSWIPREALTSGIRGLWTVFSVKQQSGQQALSAKAVEVLYTEGERAFVRGALKDGEWLVAQGTHRLVPNQVVNVSSTEDQELVQRP